MSKRFNSELVLRNDLGEIRALKAFVADFCAEAGLAPGVGHKITLVLEELAANVINHGFDPGIDQTLRATLTLDKDRIVLVLEDDGRPFNPLDAPPPVLDGDAGMRPVGGLGVHLVENLVDGIDYVRDGGCNRVTMEQRIAR